MCNYFGMFVVFLSWSIWCFLHSLLIARPVTSFFRDALAESFVFYRLSYVLFSLFSSVSLLFCQFQLEQRVLFAWQGPWFLVQLLLLMYALALFVGGLLAYDLGFLFGISQIRAYLQKRSVPEPPFLVKGMLRYLRHPWYSGGIAFVLGIGPVTDISLVEKIVLSAYLVVGAFLEEQKLRIEIGEPYRKYQERVPMFFPKLPLGKTPEK